MPVETRRRLRPAAAVLTAVALAWSAAAAGGLRAAGEDPALAPAESVGMSTERLRRIDTYFQRYIDANQIAGAVSLVARDGQVVHHAAQGWRHKEAGVPMTKDTIFEMASIRPYTHFNIRPMFSNVVTQAVIDTLADRRSKIMGRPTPH